MPSKRDDWHANGERSVWGSRARFIGRDAELAHLRAAALSVAESGGGRTVVVSGEAGLGKSRLVAELRGSLDPSFRWTQGRTSAQSVNTPYALLADLLAEGFGIRDTDGPERVAGVFEEWTGRHLPDQPDAAAYLGRLFSIESPQLAEVDPEQWRERLFDIVGQLLCGYAAAGPTVICLEDIHWADPSSLALLRHLTDVVRPPALFVCTCRPPFCLAPAEELGQHETVTLHPLVDHDAERVVRSLLGTASAPPELMSFVQQRASGNPFLIEESLAALADRGALVEGTGGWSLAASPEDSDIPAGFEDVMAARLEGLQRTSRQVLREAAVIGQSFSLDLLEQVAGEQDHLQERLELLQAADLITADQDAGLYAFRHALVQQAAYNDMPGAERSDMHERVARTVERLSEERLPSVADSLAYHYSRGLSLESAVQYLMLSAGQSMSRFALEEAHTCCETAYGLIVDSERGADGHGVLLADLLNAWVYISISRGQHAEVADTLERHKETIEGLDDPARQAAYYLALAPALIALGRLQDAYECGTLAIPLAEYAGDRLLAANAHHALLWTSAELGRLDEAVQHGWQCRELIEGGASAHMPPFVARQMRWSCLNGLGITLYYKGDARTAWDLSSLANEASWDHDKSAAAVSSLCQAFAHHADGDLAEARAACENGLEHSPDPAWAMALAMWRSTVLAEEGSEELAEAPATELWRATAGRFYQVAVPSQLCAGYCQCANGRFRDGFETLAQAMAIAEESGGVTQQATALLLIGRSYLRLAERVLADGAAAIVAADLPWIQALRMAEEIGARGTACSARLDLARLHGLMERVQDVRAHASLALADAGARGASGYARQAKELLAAHAG